MCCLSCKFVFKRDCSKRLHFLGTWNYVVVPFLFSCSPDHIPACTKNVFWICCWSLTKYVAHRHWHKRIISPGCRRPSSLACWIVAWNTNHFHFIDMTKLLHPRWEYEIRFGMIHTGIEQTGRYQNAQTPIYIFVDIFAAYVHGLPC